MKYLHTYEYKHKNYDQLVSDRRVSMYNRFKKSTQIRTKEEAITYIIENCKEWLENPIDIRRGLQDQYEFFYAKPIKRVSRDCANYYTLIMDNDKSWREFPKRSKSFICSLGSNHMGSYKYNVIPEDGSRWGFCPTDDIYDSFINTVKEIGNSANWCNRFLYNIPKDNYGIELSDTNWIKFKQGVAELEKIKKGKPITNYDINYDFYTKFDEEILKKPNILKNIIKLFDPVENNFKVMDFKDINIKDLEIGVECWTDSPCIFRNRTTTDMIGLWEGKQRWEDFKNEVLEKYNKTK